MSCWMGELIIFLRSKGCLSPKSPRIPQVIGILYCSDNDRRWVTALLRVSNGTDLLGGGGSWSIEMHSTPLASFLYLHTLTSIGSSWSLLTQGSSFILQMRDMTN